MSFEKVLVICYGNIFRSPLAAELLRRELAGIQDCEIRSAGFHEPGGRRTPDEFTSLVEDRVGIQLENHRSRVVTAADVTWADAVLIMDRTNWYRLATLDATCVSKVIWVGAFGPVGSCDIRDPYGQSPQVMAAIIDQLDEATMGLAKHLVAARNIVRDVRNR